MSVHLCFQEAYRFQVPWKSSDWTFNQSLFQVSKSHLTLLCCSFGRDFVLFFSGLSLWLCSSLFFRNTFSKDAVVSRRILDHFVCLPLMGRLCLPGSCPLSCGSENTGAGFPHLSCGFVLLEHLLLLRLCIAWYWLWVLSWCTWLVQTGILCCPFLELFYTDGRWLLIEYLKQILFTFWSDSPNTSVECPIVSFPEEPFQDLFLRCKDYPKGVKSALRELGLTLLWSLCFFKHF